jgi:hypothetical protein
MASSMAPNSAKDKGGASGADAARQGPHDPCGPALAPTPGCVVTSAESEARCLTRFLKRSAWAAGILIASLIAVAIVISAFR